MTVPTHLLWMPDVIIEDMIDNKVISSPYLYINNNGSVEYRNDQVVFSTCKMTGYKFPFDIQTCNLTFKSLMHSDKDIELISNENNTEITEWSREVMRSQYEWLFVSLTVTEKTVHNKTKILYVITMKRRSVLYVANFLLPVFFFLCLDLASLLISHRGGEKLSFKVTVLLAVTVMQLILNEILPTSTDRIPLIATYCIGVFGMMMISVIETIFVMYLMEKDFQDDETDRDQSLNESHEDKLDKGNFHSCFRGMKKRFHCASDDETSVPKEGISSQLTEVSLSLEKLSDELGEIDRKMTRLSSGKEEEKPGYWTRMAKKSTRLSPLSMLCLLLCF
ncbi:5-hydroxytryptamine receptor 3A-like [Acanthochromis polyacanthus]|uniref:5-hydroxytryptamine receptor 3A-like n=1 Tax=Acanthochromis polyacanthus TaxID=80966 RepID=UPI0022340349|nr:5-hydroxytryptamine receptor 3A-like [Acanthochromis polyacanthus]